MQDSAISYRIEEGQKEKPGNSEVTKGKPISCVTEIRKPRISLSQAEIHESNPTLQTMHIGVGRGIGNAENLGKKRYLTLEW